MGPEGPWSRYLMMGWSKRGTQSEHYQDPMGDPWKAGGVRGVGGSAQGQGWLSPEMTPGSAALASPSCTWDTTAVVSWWP